MTAQDEFDSKYMSSTELCVLVGVTRATLRPAITRGTLPQPVEVCPRGSGNAHVMLWLRAEVTPMALRWRDELRGWKAA